MIDDTKVHVEDLPPEAQERVKEKAKEQDTEKGEKKSVWKKMFGERKNKDKSFTEDVKEKYSQQKSKPSTNKKGFGSKLKKGIRKNVPSSKGAGYTSLLGTRLDEGAVHGNGFIDPFAVEREVTGGKSPFSLSMGRPPPPDLRGGGSLPAPWMPSGFPTPGEMMGWGKPKSRKRR
jgi:hypothetical protein